MNAANPNTETDRVRRNTSASTLQELDQEFEDRIRYYATQPAAVITRRIEELDKEWSMERWLETNASALAFTGTVLGLTLNRKWLALPLIVTGFLFRHAVQGWCPPVPVLRQRGVRTRGEIDREKYALKILRGDFKDMNFEPVEPAEPPAHVNRVLRAVGTT